MPAATESQASASGGTAIAFGPSRLLSAQRLLLGGDKPLRLGDGVYDILTGLVERAADGLRVAERYRGLGPTPTTVWPRQAKFGKKE
jgi:hypothetical protein